ncbi:hypothetical protein Pmani_028875 [Petrolisthes manimaculis]|uniref:Uncharacterized protein n=1 Tax=Petrolisthes manimaculis TaxID=1843537 RepID=A0AAE1P0R6_9EUCA|nr:hypothetical protein Pmani_028875 [Petrolisthes manimaculis]
MNCMGLSSRANPEISRPPPDTDPPPIPPAVPPYPRTESFSGGHSSSPSPRIDESHYFSLGGVPSPRTPGGLPAFSPSVVDDMFLNGQLLQRASQLLPPHPQSQPQPQQDYESVYATLGALGEVGGRSRSLDDVLGRRGDTSRSPKLLQDVLPPSPRFSVADIEAEDDDEDEFKTVRSEDDGNDAGDEDTSFEDEPRFLNDYVYGFYDEVQYIAS